MTEEKIQVIEKRDVGLIVAALVMLALSAVLQVTSTVLVVRDAREVAHQARTAAETHHGVCLYRANLEDQIGTSTRYLIAHPNGAPALGLSRAFIQNGIDKQRAAVESLSDLHC